MNVLQALQTTALAILLALIPLDPIAAHATLDSVVTDVPVMT